MKNLKNITLVIVSIMGIALISCEEDCVRCEDGSSSETKCFTDDDKRDLYLLERETEGFTCTIE